MSSLPREPQPVGAILADSPLCQCDEGWMCGPCQDEANDVWRHEQATKMLDQALALAITKADPDVNADLLEGVREVERPCPSATWTCQEHGCDGCLMAASYEPVPPETESYDPTPEDRAETAAVYAEMDARQHLDHSERLTLAELVDRQSEFFRGWSNAAGTMLAEAMAELALKVRLTDATTPADFAARKDALDAGVREAWEAIGFEDGRRQCQDEPMGSAFGHMA